MNIESPHKPFAESRTFKVAIYMLYAVLAVVILVIAKPFLVPLAWSLVIALSSVRMLNKLETKVRINRNWIIIGFILLVIAAIILIFYFFYVEIRKIMLFMPEFAETFENKSHDFVLMLRGAGMEVPEHIDRDYLREVLGNHTDIIVGFLSEFGKNIGNIFLIGFYLFFLLSFRNVLYKFIKLRFRSRDRIDEVTKSIRAALAIVNNYMYGLLLLTGITIVMNYIVFLVFGMHYALFFAVLVGLLNILPYVGNPIAMIVTFMFSVLTMDSLTIPIVIQAGLFITNFIQDNILKPWLLGDKLHVNAFMIFLSVVVGGYIWGFSGMLLFIPLVGVTKIILEKNDATRPYVVFFSELSPRENKTIDHKIIEEIRDEP